MSSRILEQAALLGSRKSLVGVVTSPVQGSRVNLPAVVILNAGIVHRTGPNRMSVLLARALASAGTPVLRFDLSGIGDSEPRADSLPPLDSSLADIREAMDWMESTRRTRRVVLIGLCSGADHIAVYGGSDPRVVGAVLIDPSMPRTTGFYLRHYGRRLLRLRSWFTLVGRLKSDFRKDKPAVAPDTPTPDDPLPSLDDPAVRGYLGARYQSAVDNGVRMLTVLTGGRENLHNYPNQLVDAFPNVSFGDSLRVEYFGDADHTFDAEDERTRLIDLIVEWTLQTEFAGESARADGQSA
jgi:dienelactone hydrolase